MHSIVFILNPPSKNPYITTVAGGKKPTQVAFYEGLKQDGFAQSRGKSVVTGLQAPYSNHITEIKTPHNFKKNEVKAILVPEHLAIMATEIFTSLTIIPVVSKRLKLQSIPEILEKYHNEVLKKPLEIDAPDYHSALSTFCKEKKLEEFSIHAVRLHTNFDFMVRPIFNVSDNEHLMKLTHSKIAVNYEDNSALIVVHKNYGQSKQNVIKRLRDKNFLPEKYILKMEKGGAFSENLNMQFTELKNGLILSNIYKKLSESQLQMLIDPAIKISVTEHFSVLAYPPILEPYVNKVVNNFTSMNEAATKIQAIYRGTRTQTFFQDYQEKYKQLQIAQQEFEMAGENLKKLGSW